MTLMWDDSSLSRPCGMAHDVMLYVYGVAWAPLGGQPGGSCTPPLEFGNDDVICCFREKFPKIFARENSCGRPWKVAVHSLIYADLNTSRSVFTTAINFGWSRKQNLELHEQELPRYDSMNERNNVSIELVSKTVCIRPLYDLIIFKFQAAVSTFVSSTSAHEQDQQRQHVSQINYYVLAKTAATFVEAFMVILVCTCTCVYVLNHDHRLCLLNFTFALYNISKKWGLLNTDMHKHVYYTITNVQYTRLLHFIL